MSQNQVLFLLIVIYCLCSMGESGVVASKRPLESHLADEDKRMFILYSCIDIKLSYFL